MAKDKINNPSEKLRQANKIANKKRNTPNAFQNIEEAVLRLFRWFSSLLDRIFSDGRYTAIAALVLALFMYISVNISSANLSTALLSSKTLSDVTVTTRYNNESFEITGIPNKCDVIITGEAANVNTAATRNGYCLLNLEGYTEGTHTINLSATGFGDNVSTTVTPSQTTITLKRKTTATFDISYDFINQNSLDSKYILGLPEFKGGSKVNIRASQDTLNTISMVKALIDVTGMKEGVNTTVANLVAYDSKGQQVNAEIVPNVLEVNVGISSPSKTVPINLVLIGDAPSGFAIEAISMDHQNTQIYAPQSVLDSLNSVSVTLDLSTITTDANIMLPVNLPAGVASSEVTMVNVSATLGLIATKEINDVPIIYRNNDNNLGASDVDFATVTIMVYGTENNIENISASDVVAYIDLKDSDGNLLEEGTHELLIQTEKNTDAYVSFSSDPSVIHITLIKGE